MRKDSYSLTSQAKNPNFQWIFCESTLMLCSDLSSSYAVSYDPVCEQEIQVFKYIYIFATNE